MQPFEDPNATFIRGITYRSIDSFRFAELHKEINDLKKVAVKRKARKEALPRAVCVMSTGKQDYYRSGIEYRVHTMDNDYSTMSKFVMVYSLRVYQTLMEECTQRRSLIKSDDTIVCLNFFQ